MIQTMQGTIQNSNKSHAADAKREEMAANEPGLVLVILLIGLKDREFFKAIV